MVNNLVTQGQLLAAPLAGHISDVQRWMDSLLVRADGVPPQSQPKAGLPIWAIVLIVVVAAPLCLILAAVCVIAILTLLGPSIGNVFSNVQGGI
jgi:hypothetical protein